MKFVIVNTMDRPYENLVATHVPGVGYCYLDRRYAVCDGMADASRPTPLEDFGLDVEEISQHHFEVTRRRPTKATYTDGSLRPWQGKDNFYLDFEWLFHDYQEEFRAQGVAI